MSVQTEFLGSVDNVNRQAGLISPHTHIINFVSFWVDVLIGPNGSQNTGIRHSTRTNVRLSQAGGVFRDTEISPWSVDGLFGASLGFQIVDVLDFLRVQVENVVVVVLIAQDVLLNDSFALILGVIGDTSPSFLLFDVVILEISTILIEFKIFYGAKFPRYSYLASHCFGVTHGVGT